MAPAHAAKSTKKRGRRPNEKRRDAICKAISEHGDTWRDHLGDGERIRASKWEDLDFAQGKQRTQIIDMLRKYADLRN